MNTEYLIEELEIIRERRWELGLSRIQLANALGVHEKTIFNWENAKRPIPLYQYKRIKQLFKI